MITEFDRSTLNTLRSDIEAALKGVGEQHGITFSFNSIRFAPDMFSTRLEARVGGDANEHAKKDWEKYCWRFGLKAEDFGKSFSYGGERYTIIGIKPRSKKYPVLVKTSKGKTYKMPADVMRDVHKF